MGRLDGLEVLTVGRWLWKQKYRIDRGYQLISLVNLGLLLVTSSSKFNVSGSTMVLFGAPLVIFSVWFVGYLMTLPSSQISEDRAMADTTQGRRDMDTILRLLKEIHDDHRRSNES